MQHILCPQDMIILVMENIRITDQHGNTGCNMSDVGCQEIKTGSKEFQQAIDETSGPSFCYAKSMGYEK